MSRNLKNQLRSEVFSAFRENRDKHAEKRSGTAREDVIYGITSRNNLLDTVKNFCKHGIDLPRNPRELTPKHVMDFLDKKAIEGCTQDSIDRYRSELKKLGKIIGVDLGVEKVLANKTGAPNRGASDVISHDDLAKLLAYFKSHPSKSGACIILEREVGVRVSDMAYGVHIGPEALKIHCKGNKWLTRPITPEIREIINSKIFQSMVQSDGSVKGVKDDTINKQLRRVEDKLGIERHSFHAIRRRIAQDKYNEFRSAGFSRSEALKEVSLWLNHGEKRDQLMKKSYVSDAW